MWIISTYQWYRCGIGDTSSWYWTMSVCTPSGSGAYPNMVGWQPYHPSNSSTYRWSIHRGPHFRIGPPWSHHQHKLVHRRCYQSYDDLIGDVGNPSTIHRRSNPQARAWRSQSIRTWYRYRDTDTCPIRVPRVDYYQQYHKWKLGIHIIAPSLWLHRVGREIEYQTPQFQALE